MDYTEMVRDALAFTRQGVFENKGRWMRLILGVILLALPMNGYILRIYRGETHAPEVDQWGRLFIDGLKLTVVGIIWSIPIIVIWLATYGALVAAIISGNTSSSLFTSWKPNLFLVLLMYLAEIVVGILLPVAMIRFARSDRFAEAFNFRAIFGHIGKIGWLGYILGLIIVAILVAVPMMVLICIFILVGIVAALATGFSTRLLLAIIAVAVLVILIVAPLFTVFQARYWTRLYDCATPVPVAE